MSGQVVAALIALFRVLVTTLFGFYQRRRTHAVRHLALHAALGETPLPVYVELRNLVDSGMQDLVSYVVAMLDDRYGFDDAGLVATSSVRRR